MKKMTKGAIGSLIFGLAFAFVAVLSPIATPSVSAQSPIGDCSDEAGIANGISCGQGRDVPTQLFGAGSIFTTIVNVLLFIIGAISVIMLIFGGIRYTVSGGDSGAVSSAKNTILYAIIGLIIAFLAFAIVNWVLGAVNPSA